LLRVVEVVDAFTLKAEFGSVGALSGQTVLQVSFGFADLPVASLLWSDKNRPNRMPPRFLGYGDTDALFAPFPAPVPPFVSPYSYDLDPPKCVLLVLNTPNGATHTNHAWGESNLPNIFAKIILYPQFRLERNYPMIMMVPEVLQISQVQFLWLNPDHTPYQFHGKNWSCTLNFVVVEPQIQQGC
jgi:hypothetical protein